MKRLLTFLIVIALVIVAGFKAAVWWFANERMAEARTGLEAWGVLDRGTIGSGLDGRLFLSDSSWQDFRLTRPLEIGKLEFDAGSPLDLITTLVDPGSMPARWTIQAEGLGLMLEATMFRNWVTAEGETGEGEPALFVLSCAPDSRQQLGSGDLMRMGITGIRGEALLRQTPEGLHGELSTAGTGSIDVDWPGARLDLTVPDRLLSSSPGAMTVTIRDGGLMRKVAAYCARENGLQPQQWAGQAAQAMQRGFQARGLVASDQLIALYRQWLMEGGELTLKLEPGQSFLGIPAHAADADGSALADWAVLYNGARVPGVYLQEQPAPVVVEEPSGSGPAAEELDPGEPGWHRDAVDNAGNWVGRQVRVTLSNDNVVEGRLVSVTDRELEVARVVAGGEVAYPMLVRAIVGFEVWRLGRGD